MDVCISDFSCESTSTTHQSSTMLDNDPEEMNKLPSNENHIEQESEVKETADEKNIEHENNTGGRRIPRVQRIAKAIINISRFVDFGDRLHEQSIHKSRVSKAASSAPRYAWQGVGPYSKERAEERYPSLMRKQSTDDIDVHAISREKNVVNLEPLSRKTDTKKHLCRMRSRSMDDLLSPRSPSLQPLGVPNSGSNIFFSNDDHSECSGSEVQFTSLKLQNGCSALNVSPKSRSARLAPLQGKRVVSAPLLFWRCRMNAQVCVFYHEHCDTFEIIPYDTITGKEFNRIYSPASKIFKILEEKLHIPVTLETPAHRLKKVKLATDYILATLNAQYKDSTRSEVEMIMRRFNAELDSMENLEVGKPAALDPAHISDKRRKSRALNSSTVETLTGAVKFDITGATVHVDKAQKFEDDTVKSIQQYLCQKSTTLKYMTDISINPSRYSKVRWKWIWAIDRVINLNNIDRAVGSMFGGMGGQVVESTKGRIDWDVKARRGFNLNPYLNNGTGLDQKYHRPSEIEKFQQMPSFRPLRYVASNNSVCAGTNNDFKRISKIRHHATEVKKKGNDPKGRRHSCTLLTSTLSVF